jgi:hypothetical protein
LVIVPDAGMKARFPTERIVRVRFEAVEAFRGVNTKSVVALTSPEGEDGVSFKIGDRRLVYAFKTSDSPCNEFVQLVANRDVVLRDARGYVETVLTIIRKP